MSKPANVVSLPVASRQNAEIAEFSKKYKRAIQHAGEVQLCYEVSELIPLHDCERIIQLIYNENYKLANEPQANALAYKLIDSYVAQKLAEKEHYINAICDIFMDYSAEDGREAIKRIVRTCEFPPQPATVNKHLEEIVAERKRALWAAERSRMAHEERRLEREREEQRLKERTPENLEKISKMLKECIASFKSNR